jgi:histidinol-phosphate/aromatic aminotransferase/cobyric acid decarboxylase-like protein
MDREALARLAGEAVPHGSADEPDLLDFSSNVNPEVPAGAERVYRAAFDDARSYPPDGYDDYRRAAAAFVGCEPGQVIPTAGGLRAIRLAVVATVDPGESALLPAPTFGEYAREVRLQGGDPVRVPHDELLGADPAGYALVVVCTPNNPTGDAYNPAALRAFAERCRAVGTPLLVDEAFLGFTDLPSLAGAEGVVVARSLTKLFGLPGLRAGFAVATGNLRDRIAAARETWGLGVPAAAVGEHCLGQTAFVAATRDRVRRERSRLRAALAERFEVYEPSSPDLRSTTAPFVLFDAGSAERVDGLLASARAAGVALRDARTFERLNRHVRVAVRRPRENDRLLEALDVRD